MSKQYAVKINRQWCKNCGICAAYCPKDVLSINEKKILEVLNPKLCIGCRMCQYRCPDMAIKVKSLEVKQND